MFRPLSVPLPLENPESRGAGGGAGLRPDATGRFAGGAGGVGLERIAAPFTPFVFAEAGGGGGACRTTGAAGGGGGACSWR